MKIKSPASSLVGAQARQQAERMNTLFNKISSGSRITKAADDAASLAISSAMESQIAGLRATRQNANEADSMLQVADSGAEQGQEIIGKMRELATSMATSTKSDADRANAQIEYAALEADLDKLAETDFNDRKVLDGAQTFTFQIGSEAGQMEVSTEYGSSAEELGVDGTSVATAEGAQEALGRLDTAAERLTDTRTRLGSGQGRLRSVSSTIETALENTVSANSQIRDLDMAEALSAQAREAILQQSSIAILMQANAQPQAALNLIG